jgi:hypothetical protein
MSTDTFAPREQGGRASRSPRYVRQRFFATRDILATEDGRAPAFAPREREGERPARRVACVKGSSRCATF